MSGGKGDLRIGRNFTRFHHLALLPRPFLRFQLSPPKLIRRTYQKTTQDTKVVSRMKIFTIVFCLRSIRYTL